MAKDKSCTIMKPNEFGVTDITASQRFAFPIPLMELQWENTEELNTALELEIYKERVRDPVGVYRSNTSGTWHSDTDLLNRLDGPFATLKQMWANAFMQYAISQGCHPKTKLGWDLRAWAMIYSDRGYATAHNHPQCHFAGVYYVRGAEQEAKVMATGDKVRPGTLEFVTPHQHDVWANWANLAPMCRVEPKEGKMVLFPSWLFHFVHPVVGQDDRIAVACNGLVKKFELFKEEETK